MPNNEPCPFVTAGREQLHCTLELGHAGSHLGPGGGRLLTAEESDAIGARFDALSVEELQALVKDPAALQAFAEEAAPDPVFQAQVEAATDAAIAVVDQRRGDAANTDPLAELRLAMLLLDAKRTEGLATFQAQMLVDPHTGPLVAGAMDKAAQVAKREALTSQLEPLMKEAADHFMLAVPHWQQLHAEMLAKKAPLAAKLPSPPDLFAGVIVGVATVRLAPTEFSSKEAWVLTQPWEKLTGDGSHGRLTEVRESPPPLEKSGAVQLGVAAPTAGDSVGGCLFYLVGLPLLFGMLFFLALIGLEGVIPLRDETGAIAGPYMLAVLALVVIADVLVFWWVKVRPKRGRGG